MRSRLAVLGVLIILSLLIGIGYWQPTSTARADRRQQSTPETITVTGFTPAQVMVGHSDLLTISGTGFTATLTVEITGATVASVQFVDAKTLQVPVPTSLTAGQYPVAVRD